MKVPTILTAAVSALTLGACAHIAPLSAANATNQADAAHKPVYELAINQAKEGQLQAFAQSRAAFVSLLGKDPATVNDGKWQPFFTATPNLDLTRIVVGMTHWQSMQGFGQAAATLLPKQESKDYFATFTPLAYGLLEPVDGQPFDLDSLKAKGQVVEFAIRSAKTPDAFGNKRDVFFNSIAQYDGFVSAREFRFYELDEKGIPKLVKDTQAVIIVWDSADKFQAAAKPIFASKSYADFSAVIDVKHYFATLYEE